MLCYKSDKIDTGSNCKQQLNAHLDNNTERKIWLLFIWLYGNHVALYTWCSCINTENCEGMSHEGMSMYYPWSWTFWKHVAQICRNLELFIQVRATFKLHSCIMMRSWHFCSKFVASLLHADHNTMNIDPRKK